MHTVSLRTHKQIGHRNSRQSSSNGTLTALFAVAITVYTQNFEKKINSYTSITQHMSAWAALLEWVTIVVLVVLSGLFSGLNLGLMGLDPVDLEVVMSGMLHCNLDSQFILVINNSRC